ncbi:hypothetical protein [uncultured Treponema sp.]|uniref:hypothetical protein n=1 Tax=uncultured Treponema sp. TaxID=162155 RepID=UPI0025FAE2CB|nr:hypothetical protein [uncultured Treponema sp.]
MAGNGAAATVVLTTKAEDRNRVFLHGEDLERERTAELPAATCWRATRVFELLKNGLVIKIKKS